MFVSFNTWHGNLCDSFLEREASKNKTTHENWVVQRRWVHVRTTRINFSPKLTTRSSNYTREIYEKRKLFIKLNGRGKVASPFIDCRPEHVMSSLNMLLWLPDNFLLPHCSSMAHFELLLIPRYCFSQQSATCYIHWSARVHRQHNRNIHSVRFHVPTSSNRQERIVVSSLFWIFNDCSIGVYRGKATSHSRLLTSRVAQFVSRTNWINVSRVFHKQSTKTRGVDDKTIRHSRDYDFESQFDCESRF